MIQVKFRGITYYGKFQEGSLIQGEYKSFIVDYGRDAFQIFEVRPTSVRRSTLRRVTVDSTTSYEVYEGDKVVVKELPCREDGRSFVCYVEYNVGAAAFFVHLCGDDLNPENYFNNGNSYEYLGNVEIVSFVQKQYK